MPRSGYIERHGLWNAEQRDAAVNVLARVREEDVRLVRVGSVDPHGRVRAKAVTAGWFEHVLADGIRCSSAQFEFDSAERFVRDPFVAVPMSSSGGPPGLPDLVLVPDPRTFRLLPWSPGSAWILGSMHSADGAPVGLDSRHILRDALDRLLPDDTVYAAGLEMEFYITRVVDARMAPADLGGPGLPPRPPEVEAVTRGYAYQSEEYLDRLDDLMGVFVDQCGLLGLPLRTIETELGPGQIEVTFDVLTGIDVADAAVLFRSMVRQNCARRGLHATFMAAPGLPNFCPSGWHLHQSLRDGSGRNLFTSEPTSGQFLSPLGMNFLGGLLEHAREMSVFTTPTVNGYRRRLPHSLAPDRVTWGHDDRVAMCRVLGGPGDPGSHIENRVGEPAANPYHYAASQIVSGMNGVRRGLDPGQPTSEGAATTERPRLPDTLRGALRELDRSRLARTTFGDRFVDWLIELKRSEVDRYLAAEPQGDQSPGAVTAWEHAEYFTRF